MQPMKESAANMAASAKSGMEKTKATAQEKVEKMSAHNPREKAMATEKKEARKAEAEINKLEAREQNAAAKQASKVGGPNPGYTAAGTGAHTGTGEYTTGGTGGFGTVGTGTGTATYSTTEEYGRSTGGHQMSARPGHGTGQPTGGQVVEGVVESHPIGVNSGTGRTMAHNTQARGNPPGPGYNTGGTYS